jgi:hypothetical protein
VEKQGANIPDGFDLNGNSIFPHSERAVIRRRHEPAAFVDELDRVDGAQMVVVLLHRLVAGAAVVLQDSVV